MADDYLLGRDLYGSMRLDAQHLLWKLYKGYNLHPAISATEDMKIAEIGTGTGIWLLDVASQVSKNAQLDGFDLSEDQFPHRSAWPENVTFRTLDAFGEVPEELVHRYDVVHLRFWCCVVRNNDPSGLIRHAERLLKPGGYIQWEDADVGKTLVRGDVAERFRQIVKPIFVAVNFEYGVSWLSDLKDRVQQHGLDVLESELGTIPPTLVPLCTSTYLTGHMELFKAASNFPGLDIPSESARMKLLVELMTEVKRGAAYHWLPITLLAQKPLVY
ncbi:hypothetical protein N7466_010076 [Penicillium verhagenii]|uniref:uncharacterized protein n=1 Tax=Penicillium verhagenii TaxID=1562060 RepID=UPI0025452641|nr:uncharacterized protein N7466_010076 [Penicillium verhagenii]KAJ5919133.1 hypothetical protein N7466_010076 [Penicillium verhagenii]